MLEALCDYLIEKPGLCLDKMAVFLRDEFQKLATTSSIRRALASKGWPKKKKKKGSTEDQGAKYRITRILSAQLIRFPIVSHCLC